MAYIEKDAKGVPVYYVFDINSNNGFVIVLADDAMSPVIGYSNTGHYVVPTGNTNISYWMNRRKTEIITNVANKVKASAEVKNLWNDYINNIVPQNVRSARKPMGSKFPSSSYHLVQSTWDQPSPYNADCPSGTLTGCVATAMSQIMRYWSYPTHGIGSSSYNSSGYGTLSANYTHLYRWSNMPLTNPTTADTDMARLLSDAGISVQMTYGTSASSAYVISKDNPTACAQISYYKYFGYLQSTIEGLDAYSNATQWQDTLENELDNNRPIEYAGQDPSDGGHTWVCDGYNSSNQFHMNWGWSGQDNGWYALSSLNPSSFNFSQGHEAVIGIEPPGLQVSFAGKPTSGCGNLTVNFTDKTTGSSTPTAWKWNFGDGGTSTQQNPSHTYTAPGSYAVTETVTDNTGNKDSLVQTAYITVQPATGTTLPLAQTFETGSFPPTGWVINNPQNSSTVWALDGNDGGYGKSTKSIYFNNCTMPTADSGKRVELYTPGYDFTSVSKPMIYFDVAYEPYNANHADTLAISYSTDCGSTWTNVYLKGGSTLSTTGGTASGGTDTAGGAKFDGAGCFVPTSTTWRTDTINIPAIAGKNDVMFSFENRSQYGTNLFIDNINIPTSPTSIVDLYKSGSVHVYPNPNNGSFSVELSNVQDRQQFSLYNMLGQNIYSTWLYEGKTQININPQAGVYLYKLSSSDGKMLSEGKLIVK